MTNKRKLFFNATNRRYNDTDKVNEQIDNREIDTQIDTPIGNHTHVQNMTHKKIIKTNINQPINKQAAQLVKS